MAPSTLGTFLRSFTFGHVRQLDRVLAETLRRAGAGPGDQRLVIDVDSFIGEVHGHNKQGAGYGYTRKLGYQPLLAARRHRRGARSCSSSSSPRSSRYGVPRLEGTRGRFGHSSWLFRAKARAEYGVSRAEQWSSIRAPAARRIQR